MSSNRRLGLLGGTFDPVHAGHLAVARVAQRALGLEEVRFIPSRIPPHRSERPTASGYHRFAMIALATANEETWRGSDLELLRTGPSYTYETLLLLHGQGLRPSQIFFIIGADAFAEIATWSRFPEVLDAAHFAVVERPGASVAALRHQLPGLASRMVHSEMLAPAASPHIVVLNADTPDVSSTEIRRRVRAGEPVAGLVPDAVATYIDRHALYRFPAGSCDATILALEGRLHGED